MECIAWSQLTEDDASLSQRNTPLDWTEVNGKWSATFAFEDLLEAEFRVWITVGMRVSRDLPAPSYEPRSHYTLPDGPELEFQLIEPPSAVQLEVNAIDSATGEPLAEFQAMAWLPKTGKEPRPVEGADGRALVELRGDKEGCHLWVSAAGYAPIFSNLPANPDADGKWRMTLRLDPGWGAPVQVVIFNGDERDPAAGVEVLADDQVVATTDETGVAWLSLATRPKRLHVRGSGLVLESTSGSLDGAGVLKEEPLEPMRENFFFRMRREL